MKNITDAMVNQMSFEEIDMLDDAAVELYGCGFEGLTESEKQRTYKWLRNVNCWFNECCRRRNF